VWWPEENGNQVFYNKIQNRKKNYIRMENSFNSAAELVRKLIYKIIFNLILKPLLLLEFQL
jgi:hypothetical protein